jgi:ATP-dependent DNA ligase
MDKFCMLAKDFADNKAEYPCYVEPKYDGVRVLAKVNKKEQTVNFFFRSGKPVHTLEHLVEEILTIKSTHNEFTLDGEVVSPQGFMKCVGDVRRKILKQEPPTLWFMVFDLVYDDDDRSYLVRKQELEELLSQTTLNDSCVGFIKCNDYKEVLTLKSLWEKRDSNIEGVMVKKDTLYQNKRTWDWMKIKDELSVDFPIVDFFEGQGKYKGMLGGVIVKNPDTDINIRVGGGYDDAERKHIWENQKDYLGKTAEVKYQYMTPKGSLRHPIYKGVRIDK